MNAKYHFFRFSFIDIYIYLSHSIEIISQNKMVNNIIGTQI